MRIPLPLLAAALLAALSACVRVQVHGDPAALAANSAPVRIATYNTSLYDDADQGLIRRLEAGDDGARKIAAVLQRVRPDVVLLNEFDYDADGRAADLFQRRYLEVPQPGGGTALHYRYRYLAPSNTGIPSGQDLDRDGVVGGDDRSRGNDAWGYGLHPGEYAMMVLSRYPIDTAKARTFQQFKWAALPDPTRPHDPATGAPWHPQAIWQQLRLSSKSHWDIPVLTPLGTIHLVAAHPTPPVFDGAEDRNGSRNRDEIRLLAEYLDAGDKPWLCDDKGRCGGIAADADFVVLGDMNRDPDDDHPLGAIAQLLNHPRIDARVVPRSAGAVERAAEYGLPLRGDASAHTGDFGPKTGTMRLDYVLPSRNLHLRDSGVFWPARASADAAIADGSDHHLVWVDLGGG